MILQQQQRLSVASVFALSEFCQMCPCNHCLRYLVKRFDEAYNMETVTPVHEWQAMYEEVKSELTEMGICF